MRVLLVQAVSTHDCGEVVFPLGLAGLAAAIGREHEVQGLDLNLDPFPWPGLVRTLDAFRPDVVGISFRDLDPLAGNLISFVPHLKTLGIPIRQHAPEATVALGGPAFTLFAQRLMEEVPEVDVAVSGEAEAAFPMLLQNLETPDAVPGTLWRTDGAWEPGPASRSVEIGLRRLDRVRRGGGVCTANEPQSEAHFNDIANTPLWSCLMTGYAGASLVQAGFEADIVDAARWTSAQTVQYLVDNPSPDVLAIHAVYSWEGTESLFQMLSDLRSHRFDAPICLYGFFPGLAWKEILDYSAAVDYVIVGEPEETIVDLARCIEAGIEVQVEGVALRSYGKTSFPRMRDPIEAPDRLAFPLRPSLDSEQTVSVLASRGCYNHCSFCLVPALDQGKTMSRGRSPENVAAEISELVYLEKKDFYFVDPNFVGPGKAGKETAAKLACQLADLGITFGMETRANDVTYGLMRELAAAGLTRLLLGIESGRPDVLKRLDKHTSIAGNEQAIATVREAGLEPEIGFIMFDAASTLDDILQDLKFLERNRLLDRLGRTANLQDFRVGWLAGLMKRTCHFLLKEMGKPSSPVYWSEKAGEIPQEGVQEL